MLHHRQKKKIEDLDVKEKKMMKAPFYLYLQLGHFISRTAIEAEILFAVCLIKKQALTGGKSLARENKYSKKIGAESVVLHFVFFMIIINKMQQSAKTKLLLNSPTDMPFGNRWSRYKEPSKNKAEAYRVYVEDTFLPCDAVDARIFSKDDEQAQRVYIKYGNGVETRYKYDEKRRWLDTIETKNNQTQDVFQKIKYSFDPVGNVLGYNNDASTYETKQEYKYDNLYQLISVEGTSNQYKTKKSFGSTPVSIAKYRQTFAFDGIGNMKEKISTTNIPGAQGNSYPKAELDYSLDYEYDPAYAHRLVKAGTRYYRYDANGNITAEKDGPFTDEEEFTFTYSYFENDDVYGADYGFGLDAPKETEQTNPQDLFAYRRNYTWNERNLLSKSSDRNFTVHYRYGDDGQRALKYTDEGRSETLYFNNFFTIHIPTQDQNNPQGLRVHKHIFVGNSRLVTAMTHTDNSGDNDEQKAKRYYYHSDHLGSAQFVTDWRGRQYEHIEYTPYGELWIEEVAAGLDKLPFRFTGKELDEETGLYYYGARYLDPKYSRWLSGDPALNEYIPKAPIDDEAKKHNENLPGIGGVYNTVNLHVYHYAGNNPVKYIDPDGRSLLSGIKKIFSGTLKATVGTGGVMVGAVSSFVLIADNATGVLVVDDAALLVTVPFTVASGMYALDGAREASEGVFEVVVDIADKTKELGSWIGDGIKNAWDNIFKSQKDKLGDMKKNSPNHPDYHPPKNWNGKKVKNPNGAGSGWPAANGDVWVPEDHKGTHNPHWDVQHPNGTHTPVYPE